MPSIPGLVSSGFGALGDLFGSRKPPKSILDRNVRELAKESERTGRRLLKDYNPEAREAFKTDMAGQEKQQALAGDYEEILRRLMARREGNDPNQLLQDIGRTAFGFINPAVVDPLSRFDVNSGRLDRMARGLNPASIDSTANRLRDARIASGRYYDVARQAYGALPGLYNSAYAQGLGNDQAIASYIPNIAANYNAVSARPWDVLNRRIGSAGGATGVGADIIRSITGGPAIQGYQNQRNAWDRLSTAGQRVGDRIGIDDQQSFDNAIRALAAIRGGGLGGSARSGFDGMNASQFAGAA